MDIQNDKINNLYKIFEENPDFTKKKITNKQIEYINILYNNHQLLTENKSNNIFELFSQITNKNISSWDDLYIDDASIIIDFLKGKSYNDYKKYILHKFIFPYFTFNKICDVLKKKITSIDEITNEDYKKLTYHNPIINFDTKLDKFNIQVNETTIEHTPDFEIGFQYSELCRDNKLFYIRFYEYVMIDYDNIDYKFIKKRLLDFLEINKSFYFKVYKTNNGYHVFIMSHLFSHNDKNTVRLLKLLACDSWYILFSYNSGFKIRLNSKLSHSNSKIHEFIEYLGDSKYLLDICNNYDNIINQKIKIYNL